MSIMHHVLPILISKSNSNLNSFLYSFLQGAGMVAGGNVPPPQSLALPPPLDPAPAPPAGLVTLDLGTGQSVVLTTVPTIQQVGSDQGSAQAPGTIEYSRTQGNQPPAHTGQQQQLPTSQQPPAQAGGDASAQLGATGGGPQQQNPNSQSGSGPLLHFGSSQAQGVRQQNPNQYQSLSEG